MQKNLIGKSFGSEIDFKIEGDLPVKNIKCFTTRPDTLFGFSFLALSIDHEISQFYRENRDFIKFKEECSKTGTTEEAIAVGEKIGFKTNLIAVNPLNPKQKAPVYFANFVLMDYGFGAVFGCPAHDQRDFEFAKKYNLEIKTVVKPFEENDNFDPYIHEAILKTESDSEDGSILNVLRNGYVMNDEVIRPTQVEIAENFKKKNNDKEK